MSAYNPSRMPMTNRTLLRTHHCTLHTCSHVRIYMMLRCVYVPWLTIHGHNRPSHAYWFSLGEQCRNLCLRPRMISSLPSTSRHVVCMPRSAAPRSPQRSSPSVQWQAVESLTTLGAKTELKWVKVSSVCSYIGRLHISFLPSPLSHPVFPPSDSR